MPLDVFANQSEASTQYAGNDCGCDLAEYKQNWILISVVLLNLLLLAGSCAVGVYGSLNWNFAPAGVRALYGSTSAYGANISRTPKAADAAVYNVCAVRSFCAPCESSPECSVLNLGPWSPLPLLIQRWQRPPPTPPSGRLSFESLGARPQSCPRNSRSRGWELGWLSLLAVISISLDIRAALLSLWHSHSGLMLPL